MAERPDLTIVLININHRDVLRDCLTSIYEHINGLTLEVVVVDNASSDGSVEMLRECFPQQQPGPARRAGSLLDDP